MPSAAMSRSDRVDALQPTAFNAILSEVRELQSQEKKVPGGEGTLRVSFATGGETLEWGLDRLRGGLTRIGESI